MKKIGEYIRQFLIENTQTKSFESVIEPKTPFVNIDDIYLKDAHIFFPKIKKLHPGNKIVFTAPRIVYDKKGRGFLKGMQYIYGKVIGKSITHSLPDSIEIEVIRAEIGRAHV